MMRSQAGQRSVAIAWLIAASAAAAVAQANAAETPVTVTIEPKKLSVCGPQRQQTALALQLQASADVSLQFLSSQLQTSDGCCTLPSTVVSVNDGKSVSLSANVPVSVPVTIDTSKASSGEYTGDLSAIQGTGGTPAKVTVTLRLKDQPWWALLVLGIGVGLSYLLSHYRETGWRRDQLIVRTARIEDMLANDDELRQFQSFSDQLRSQLNTISDRLAQTSPDYAAAEKAADEAHVTAGRWLSWRPRWVAARMTFEQLKTAANINTAASELQAAKKALQDAPTAVNPASLEDALETLRAKLGQSPAGGAAVATWPKIRFNPAQVSTTRLKIFGGVSTLIALLLLCAAGFKQLYSDVPTFGANGFADYVAVFAWGFGAEATRKSILDVVRTWDIHGFK